MTGEQLRAALAALAWTRKNLSDATGINPRTIQRMAETSGQLRSYERNIEAVKLSLEKGDDCGRIEFLDRGAPGIRFHNTGK